MKRGWAQLQPRNAWRPTETEPPPALLTAICHIMPFKRCGRAQCKQRSGGTRISSVTRHICCPNEVLAAGARGVGLERVYGGAVALNLPANSWERITSNFSKSPQISVRRLDIWVVTSHHNSKCTMPSKCHFTARCHCQGRSKRFDKRIDTKYVTTVKKTLYAK